MSYAQNTNPNKPEDKLLLEKKSEYRSDQNSRKVFSNNFFDKIKPIVKSLKNNPKFKKLETKDQSTWTEETIKIVADLHDYNVVDKISKTPKVKNAKTVAIQTKITAEKLLITDPSLSLK